uniref:Uncharacterized protein n=1 Tax=Fusarium oxysporum (strain Fo5176) TaxID=660025 RepID=A0A0D2XBT1_FUSOF
MRSGTPTLLVVAPWSSEKTPTWEKAMQEMIVSLAELFKASYISEGDIHVEIVTPEFEQTVYFVAPNDASLHGNWDWYGVIPDPQDNPLIIYISVDFGSDETGWRWPTQKRTKNPFANPHQHSPGNEHQKN